MEAALDIVQKSQRIVLSGHLRADGDCLGSESVLYHAFKALGKKVLILNPDPPDQRYGFLHEHTPFQVYTGPDSLPDYDALFVSDCSSLGRLGSLGEEVAQRSGVRVAVDHHVLEDSDRKTWTAMVHDVTAPASGLLAMRFAEKLGVDLPHAALESAFVSLATDTGWFKYSNAGLPAWAAATELIAKGVVPERIYRLIYQHCDGGRPRGIAAALSTVEYHRDGRLALAWLSQDMLAQADGTLEDTDEVLDILRGVQEVEVVGFLFERKSGVMKASLRSKSVVDVNRAARSLGGGGHARASGVTFDANVGLEESVDKVRTALLDALDATLAAGQRA